MNTFKSVESPCGFVLSTSSLGGSLQAVAVACCVALWMPALHAGDEPQHTIRDVMQEHKKGALKDRVLDGSASEADQKKLLELYQELGKNKPPKGSQESWKKLTDALIQGAKAVVDGREDGVEELRKAVRCGGCHSAHKGG